MGSYYAEDDIWYPDEEEVFSKLISLGVSGGEN